MAANSGNGNKPNRSANPNSKSNKKILKFNAEQYWKLSYKQLRWEIMRKEALNMAKDAEILVLKKNILVLQHQLRMNGVSTAKAKELREKLSLEEYRTELAQKLGIESLDPYIVDTDTFELVHEASIESKI